MKKVPTNARKADSLFEWGDGLSQDDTARSVAYIRRGLDYTKGNAFGEGLGHFYLGRVYMDFSPDRAEAAFDTAIRYFRRVATPESYVYQSRTWANKAVMAQLNGDNKRYIDLFLNQAIPLAAMGGDSLRMADGYANVALPFMNYGEYDKAITYLTKSAGLFRRLAPKDMRQVDVYCHLAKIYVLQNQLDEAGENLAQASAILEQGPESMYAANFHAIESMYLIKRKRWKEAGHSIEKGLAIARKLKNRYDVRQLLYQKSGLFAAQRNWQGAKQVLLDMHHQGYVELITDKKQLFGDLAKLDYQLGNYKQAYGWMLEHEEVSDEIYNQETKAKIADLEAKYNYVQKEKELLIAKGKTKKQQAVAWITVIVFLASMVAVYIGLRSRRSRTEREIQNLKQQQRIDLGKALLEGEEKERGRLARDLHDGMGGMLAGIKLNLSQMAAEQEPLKRSDLEQTIGRLGHAVNELRRIARNMMPESLLRSGLEVALGDLCDEATLPGQKVTFRAFDLRQGLSPQVQVMIYRIVQELVSNAIRHAGASKIMVQCSQSAGMFLITIEDDGKGFSPERVPDTSRGLKNIRDRASLLNGKMDIETSTEGTNINIELHVG